MIEQITITTTYHYIKPKPLPKAWSAIIVVWVFVVMYCLPVYILYLGWLIESAP